MSETWCFKCLICDKESEDGLNHGDEILLNVLRYIEVIKILLDSDKYGYLEISIMGRGTEPISFLMEHYGEGHELVVKSEYGKIKKVDKDDVDNSLKNVVSKTGNDNIVSKIIMHLEILRNAQKATTGLPNDELDNLIVHLKTKKN